MPFLNLRGQNQGSFPPAPPTFLLPTLTLSIPLAVSSVYFGARGLYEKALLDVTGVSLVLQFFDGLGENLPQDVFS